MIGLIDPLPDFFAPVFCVAFGMITEKDLHFIWLAGGYARENLIAEDGSRIDVIFEGIYNRSRGPDFKFAKFYINNLLVVGDVELHLSTSDWAKHGHSVDPEYENVVLHVCMYRDVESMPACKSVTRGCTVLILKDYLISSVRELAGFARTFHARGALIQYGLRWLAGRVRSYSVMLGRYDALDVASAGIIGAMGYPCNEFAMRYNSSCNNQMMGLRGGQNFMAGIERFSGCRVDRERLVRLLSSIGARLRPMLAAASDRSTGGGDEKSAYARLEGWLVSEVSSVLSVEISHDRARHIVYNVVVPLMISVFSRGRQFEEAAALKELFINVPALPGNRRTRYMKALGMLATGHDYSPVNALEYFGLIYLAKQMEIP